MTSLMVHTTSIADSTAALGGGGKYGIFNLGSAVMTIMLTITAILALVMFVAYMVVKNSPHDMYGLGSPLHVRYVKFQTLGVVSTMVFAGLVALLLLTWCTTDGAWDSGNSGGTLIGNVFVCLAATGIITSSLKGLLEKRKDYSKRKDCSR